MSTRTPARLIIVILLLVALACSLPFDFNEDERDWDEYAPKESSEGSSSKEDPNIFDDDSPPVIGEDMLFLRDFILPIPLFASDSAWNQRADEAAILPDSDAQILSLYRVLLGDISSLKGYDEPVTDWPYMDISLYDFTVPIFRTGDEMQEVWICQDDGLVGWAHTKFGIETEGGPVIVPAPEAQVRPAGPENNGADGWLVLYEPETFTSYDYFAAKPFFDEACYGFEGGMIGEQILQAGVVDFFDIRGPGVNQPGEGSYSARAVGTPLLAGLILPEDIESGVIAHALSFAIPGPRNTSLFPENPSESDYFYPASTTETDFYNTDPDAIASGQRLRLKKTLYDEDGQIVDESKLAPITMMFLTALRDYGAYLVDNSGGFTFYAEDIYTANLSLSDDQINLLIGEDIGTLLPIGKTRWQIVIDRIGLDLDIIPLAVGPDVEEPDPEDAEIEFYNFEVVEPAFLP